METNEENKIQDAEISQDVASEEPQKEKTEEVMTADAELDREALAKKMKAEFRSRLILTFILGLLIGIAVKTEALKKITIGYDDYLMKIKSQSYNINDIQTNLQKQAQAAAANQSGDVTSGNATDSGGATDSGSAPVPDSGQSSSGGATNQVQN
ncbi:MAG: hypothetical protein NTY33_04490 [Candidatus Moranbacteria bacterium]|nr:hypothetical protein [Candidatus Moranbacteria bacterium]